jgi:hypothetical protein
VRRMNPPLSTPAFCRPTGFASKPYATTELFQWIRALTGQRELDIH